MGKVPLGFLVALFGPIGLTTAKKDTPTPKHDAKA